jgi:hypothetical protein
MPQHARIFYGRWNGRWNYNLNWRAISHDSFVVVTASEGQEPITTTAPQRFVGAANFVVSDIAPRDGGLNFVIDINWPDPLNVWVDVTVFDRNDPSVVVHVPFPPPG